jgi:hypothetical protein
VKRIVLIGGLLIFGAFVTTVTILDARASSQPAAAAQKDVETWPPLFPRPGATKMFENDKIIVWHQVFTGQEYMHRHVLDVVVIRIKGGKVKMMDADGKVTIRENSGPGGKVPFYSTFAKAGFGPHSEVAVDQKNPPESIYIEFKGTEPPGLVNGRWPKSPK